MPDATPLPPALRDRAFSVAEARERGVGQSRLRARDLHTPVRGVRVAQPPVDLPSRCRAHAAGTGVGVVFCGPTAAQLLGIPLPARHQDGDLHLVQRWTDRAPRGRGVVGHKTRLDPETIGVHGVRATAPIATWFALAPLLGHDELVAAGDGLVGGRTPMVTYETLRVAVEGHARARGARRIREAFVDVRPGSWSPRETRIRLALLRAGLPEPELNAAVALPGSIRYHGDLVYRERRLVLEYEGRQHLTDPVQWARDLERYNAFAAAGWRVLRISLGLDEAAVVAQIRALLTP